MSAENSTANSRLLTRGLVLLGLWPVSDNGRASNFQHFYRVYQIFLHTSNTFLFMLLMSLEVLWSDDFEYASQILKFLLTQIALVLKIINIWYYAKAAAAYLHEWETSDLFALETAEERAMWQRSQRIFRNIMVPYVIGSFNSALCALIAISFMNTRVLPFPYWIPHKWREDYYWFMYAYELLAMPFTIFSNTQIDVFQCYLLLQLTLCMRVVGMRLERLGKVETVATKVKVKEGHGDVDIAVVGLDDQPIKRRFVKIIKIHKRVVDMSKSCERVLSLPLLVQIMLSSLIICFIVYRLQSVHFSDNPVEFCGMCQYVAVMALQIFLPCYYANELTVASSNLSQHLYSCDWTGMSLQNRRFILLYMEYLKQPIVLRAGNFFEIGLPVFSKTMNNAYSLLALLLNVSADEK